MTDEEKEILDDYASFNNITISEALKSAFFDKLEDEYDIKCADGLYRQFIEDGETVPFSDVKKRYGL